MAELALANGGCALVDDDIVASLAAFRWFRDANGYIRRSKRVDGHKVAILLHREILGADAGLVVDHVDGNRADNRRANLRQCTNAQNVANQNGHANRASRFKGVAFVARKNRWRARITVAGTSLHIGYFESDETAARAYDSAALKHFGIYARLNFRGD